MSYLVYILVPLVFLGIWLYSSYMSYFFPTLVGKRICLLIAHPDDEAMFFAPTVLALTRPDLGNHLRILCLSSGDADGLGEIRKKELTKSAQILGLRNPAEDVLVLDDANFPDSPTLTWNPALLSNTLSTLLAPNPDNPEIDVLLTFDPHGVSNHPNHISCHAGALAFLHFLHTHTHTHQNQKKNKGKSGPVAGSSVTSSNDPPSITLYVLHSVSWLRKYLHILDAPLSVVSCLIAILRRHVTQGGAGKRSRKLNIARHKEYPTPMLHMSGIGDWARAGRAMRLAHTSQMVWFRWGWIGLGRFMVVNQLSRVDAVGLP